MWISYRICPRDPCVQPQLNLRMANSIFSTYWFKNGRPKFDARNSDEHPIPRAVHLNFCPIFSSADLVTGLSSCSFLVEVMSGLLFRRSTLAIVLPLHATERSRSAVLHLHEALCGKEGRSYTNSISIFLWWSGSLKLSNVWVLVQLIFCPRWPTNIT